MKYFGVIDSRGRVTVPAELRAHLSLASGDRVVFEIENELVVFRVVRAAALPKKSWYERPRPLRNQQ
jgi:AbrB family looped-hinge helix DNA binding protein